MKKSTKIKSPLPPAQFHALLQQAEYLLSLGQYQQAFLLAKHCLKLDPQNAGLLNFAGICAINLGKPDDAEQSWRHAIALGLANPDTYFNLGLLLARRQQKAEAEQCYRRAISLDPRHAQAYCNLGNLLGDGMEAEACYRTATVLDPCFEAAYYNLGSMQWRRGAWEEAEQCYRQAIAINPMSAEMHAKLGYVLTKRRRLVEAEQSYRQAITLDPGCAEAHTNLGLLLEDQQRLDEAEQYLCRALAISPDSAEVYSNLGNLLAQRDRTGEAEQCYRKALLLDPASAVAYCNLGVLLAIHKRDDVAAEKCFRQALDCDPGHALTQFNLSQLLLSIGRLEEGWVYHEARYSQSIPNQTTIMPEICAQQWQGEPLSGKSLLVLSEQGFGDAIQFCRYLPLLKARGATQITLKCRTELKTLFVTLSGVDFLVDGDEKDFPPHDYWVFLHSLPFHCKTTLENIPARIPYLHALPERLERWHLPDTGAGLRVGLAWKGNRIHCNDASRSLPGLSTLRSLWAVPGITFVSLQKGQGEDEALHPPVDQPLLNLGAEITDFADTAAIVEQLDLIICVDTSVAHLAGALGKPCWVMLPYYKTDWRWLREGSGTPWYPQTMRLFRQTTRDDWEPVVADITQALNLKTSVDRSP